MTLFTEQSTIPDMNYAICQVGSRQYLVKPGQVIDVDKLPDNSKSLSVDKILLMVEDGKIEVGTPYLKKSLDFEVMGNTKGPKIRVATYKAKSNFRRVVGQRREVTRIKLMEKGLTEEKKVKAVKKKD